MKNTACFTGHRIIKRELIPTIVTSLESVIETLIKSGIIYFRCGGAIGFDLLAGYIVLKMKKRYPQIRLIMVLPCENQDLKWSPADKKRYRQLLVSADETIYIQSAYDNQCMHKKPSLSG